MKTQKFTFKKKQCRTKCIIRKQLDVKHICNLEQNTSCLPMKDEVTFFCPPKEVVLIDRHFTDTVEKLTDGQGLLENVVALASVNHVAIITLKK